MTGIDADTMNKDGGTWATIGDSWEKFSLVVVVAGDGFLASVTEESPTVGASHFVASLHFDDGHAASWAALCGLVDQPAMKTS